MSFLADEMPSWLNYANIGVGVVVALLSLLAILPLDFNFPTSVIILSLVLIIIGIIRIVNGYFDHHIINPLRLGNIGVGVILVVIAFFAIFMGESNNFITLTLFAVAILFISIMRLFIGTYDKRLPPLYATYMVFVSVLMFLLAISVYLVQDTTFMLQIQILALSLLLSGLTRAVSGYLRSQSDL